MEKNYIEIRWNIHDVRDTALMFDAPAQVHKLLEDDAKCREVLQEVERSHDASVGINWHVIERAIHEVVKRHFGEDFYAQFKEQENE